MLSPQQFGTPFEPSKANYSGTAYAFSKQDPKDAPGDTTRVSHAEATVAGRNAAGDAANGLPTGSTTNYQVHNGGPAGDTPDKWGTFVPNQGQVEPN